MKERISKEEVIWITISSILYIVCFPLNPLILSGILEVESCTLLTVLGFIIWAFGMVLVMAPIVMFPRKGNVPKGKAFVHTTRLVDSGIYSIIRHPQQTGGIYCHFHRWLFALLGVTGSLFTCFSIIEEDKRLIEKFGDDYKDYMKRVPGMNIFSGIIRILRGKR